ncbi:THUMP domain-containing protein [Vulcanisaeta thermophila]|uniref:THUMP domain-containing protein n=1 Tax=Vulcanisaeta thermophila TaxID=867917 RepID=UPI000852CCA6|nr:THUMP domain-containing protein [Vulcanisaeta thermophila]
MSEFNLVVSTGRRLEGRCAEELRYVGELVGMRVAYTAFTGFDGLITGYVDGDPLEFVRRLRNLVVNNQYIPKFILKVVPVIRVVKTDIEEIANAAVNLASLYLSEGDTYRIDIRKRGVDIERMQLIEAIASRIKNRVNLEHPDKIIQIEIFPTRTGISVIREDDVFSLLKLSVQQGGKTEQGPTEQG